MDAVPVEHPQPCRRRSAVPWVITIQFIAIAAAGYWVWQLNRPKAVPPPAPVWRLYYTVTQYVDGNFQPPQLYAVNADGSDNRRLKHPGGEMYGVFEAVAADGRLLAYTEGTDVWRTLYVSKPDGTAAVKIDETTDGLLNTVSFTADNRQLAYTKSSANAESFVTDLYLVNIDGTAKRQLTHTPEDETPLVFSADGATLFFSRDTHAGEKVTTTLHAIDLNTGRTRAIAKADIPARPAPDVKCAESETITGRKITVGVDGDVWEEDEVLHDLYLVSAGGTKRHIAKGHEIKVLGWVRE